MAEAKSTGKSDVIEIPVGKYLSAIRSNPWVLSTVLLAIVSLILASVVLFRGSGVTGNVVSTDSAVQSLLSFVKAQGKGEATLISSEQQGALYKAVVKYQGQDVPVFITLDGKYLVTDPIPLSATAAGTAGSTPAPSTPANVPKSAKPVVELFVMSYCPYGTQTEKGILPVVGLLKDKIDFKIKFVYYAMHGEKEVRENLNQYCIQKEQPEKFFPYLRCFLTDSNSDRCIVNASIDGAKLKSCFTAADTEFSVMKNFNDKASWLSGQFPLFNTDKADNEKYQVAGSPTFVINGQEIQSGRDSVSLLNAICNAFTDKPAECSTQLDATPPAPGFGWNAAGSANLANCGV